MTRFFKQNIFSYETWPEHVLHSFVRFKRFPIISILIKWEARFKRIVRNTFKQEGFVPVRVEILPLDFGLEFVLSVRQQVDFDEGVGRPREVFSGQFLSFEYLHRQSRVLEAVAQAELNPAQFLAHRTLVVIVFWPRRQLKRASHCYTTPQPDLRSARKHLEFSKTWHLLFSYLQFRDACCYHWLRNTHIWRYYRRWITDLTILPQLID